MDQVTRFNYSAFWVRVLLLSVRSHVLLKYADPVNRRVVDIMNTTASAIQQRDQVPPENV